MAIEEELALDKEARVFKEINQDAQRHSSITRKNPEFDIKIKGVVDIEPLTTKWLPKD